MINYRLRGLFSLYVFTSTFVVALLFLLYAAYSHFAPWIKMSFGVGFDVYFIGLIAGMVGSARFIAPIGSRFHRLTPPDAAWLAFRQITLVALVTFTIIVATKDRSISRIFLATFFAMAWVALVYLNMLLPRALARMAFNKTHLLPTLFVGRSGALRNLSEWIANKQALGIQPMGFLSNDPPLEGLVGAVRYVGRPSDLPRAITEYGVSQVILLDLPSRREETNAIVEACQAAACRMLIYNDLEDHAPLPLLPIVEEGHLFFTTQDEPLEDPMNRAIKRAYDIALSLPMVIFVLPILSAWVWLMQRMQAPGPLLFIRSRAGQRHTEFMMIKFRSMYDARQDAKSESRQARPGDDRIYQFGRFLRRTSLDEFPQFFNVLKGEMSIVGPRPHLQTHDEEFSRIAKTYRSRQLVKPGITGLAQTSGLRGEIRDPEMLHRRVQLDIYYITHWTIWLDVHITLKTIREIVFPPKTAI
jgi:exopolysaccharide biosynthesis polyprenyl glycosylphosphotransferase